MPRATGANLAMLAVAACGGGSTAPSEPVGWVSGEPIEASVVQMVAERDGIDEAAAKERVADTLRAAAAASEAASQQAEPSELVPARRGEHLQRAARARLWLTHDFEPKHGPQDIPESAPELAKAKANSKYIHPRLHLLCQLVTTPSDAKDADEIFATAKDPAWQAKAKPRFDAAAARFRRYIHPDDPNPCKLMQRLMRFEQAEGDGVRLKIEVQAFDLDACGEKAEDGSCVSKQFVPEWVEAVAKAEPPGFVPEFPSRFGWHLVFVREILPARSLDDPETLEWLREQVHPQWQRSAFDEYIDRLSETKAVRIAAAAEP